MGNSYIKEMFKRERENKLNWIFGEGNYQDGNKRFNCINQVANDDEIVIITNNVQFWKNKEQFVLWVDNNKIVYLKDFQVFKVYNYEVLGNCYIVKLNRKYFKSYNCYENENMCFEKEDTFDDLLKLAKEQTEKKLWFKFDNN